MKTSSCKAKGRRACAELKRQILNTFQELSPDDIVITSSGDTGEDLKLSPFARSKVPFSFEVKNQERLNVWEALRQAEGHKGSNMKALAFTRNRSGMYVTINLSNFLFLLEQVDRKRKFE